jgi:peptidoglycan hydrolase CwlO-like protein
MRSLGLFALAGVCQSTDVTPIQKVIEMMNGMVAKGKEEKHKEEVAFNTFKVWCDNTRSETEKAIQDAADKIVQLNADIDKANADAENLKGEIKELEAAIATADDELKAATKIRNKENADYKAVHMDLSESVDALARAIEVLKSKDAKIAQASLLQIQNMPQIPEHEKVVIASFLAMATNSESGAPEAAGYEFQSGGIVSMMEKLKLKFEDQRLAAEKAEISAKGNYEVLAQQLTDDMKDMDKSVAEKTEKKAERLSDAAEAKGELEITKAAKAEDETKLSDTNAECSARTDEYEKNQVLRSEEIKAITTAQEILASPEVSGNAEKHLPQLLQTSFAQLRSANVDSKQNRERVVALLQARAKKLGSRYLALVATRAADDPFAKVKKMIKDLIVKLMEEANAEADHKGYCDTELATNKQTREIKSAEVEDLSANIDKNTADITQLADEIKTLSDDIAAINAQQAEATEIRNEEKAKNQEAIADAKVAQEAVEKAKKVIQDFYDKKAGAAFIADEMKAPYKGMMAGGGNLVDFMEVILSDFARLEAETSTEEDQQTAAHQKFMDETTEDKEVKEVEAKHKDSKKAQLEEVTRNLKKELELTQKELDAALEYYEKLKPDCVDQGLSYEDRVANREAEIESLQEALKILSGEQVA